MSDPFRDDAFFEMLAAETEGFRSQGGEAPADLKSRLVEKIMAHEEEQWFEGLPAAAEQPAPARLKCRVYSALAARQQETGPLLSLTETRRAGHDLCVFEEIVRIAPVGEKLDSFNYCRICHARALGERMERAPIFWPHCPYSEYQG